MDFFCYHFGCPPEEPRIPDVRSEGYRPPFNNILYLFQNFDFNQWTTDFKLYFNDKDPQDEVERYLRRSILPSSAKIHQIQFHSQVEFSVTWEDCYDEYPSKEDTQISPAILATQMFSSEIQKSIKVFKNKDQYLADLQEKRHYYLKVFIQLDEILGLFYHNRENYKPFENSFGSFFYWFHDLTYPYIPEDSRLPHLKRVFNNINPAVVKASHNEETPIIEHDIKVPSSEDGSLIDKSIRAISTNAPPILEKSIEVPSSDRISSIEKIVIILVDDGLLHRTSQNNLIEYLEDGIDKDAAPDSVRWLGTADSFTQFIFALRKSGQYKHPGNNKWSCWYEALKFSSDKTIEKDTLKKSYQKAKNTSDNPFISKISQALSPSLV